MSHEPTLIDLNKEIVRLKTKLSKQAIRENFGQNDVRKLGDKYARLTADFNIGNTDSYKARLAIAELDDWCSNFTGR